MATVSYTNKILVTVNYGLHCFCSGFITIGDYRVLSREEEIELIEGFRQRKPDLVKQFLDQYERLLKHQLLAAYFINTENLNDYYNEFIILLLADDCRRLRLWRKECKLSTWLATVVGNYIRDEGRIHKRQPKTEEYIEVDSTPTSGRGRPKPVPPVFQEPTDPIFTKQIIIVVKDAIKKLRKREREVIERTLFQHEDAQKIADDLGITLTNYYAILSRAKKHVRVIVGEEAPHLFGTKTDAV